MSNSYDDSKYGVITRKWFGLTKKHGGETAAGFTFGTTDATKSIHVTRWYPKGPIKLLKVGHRVLATITAGTDPTEILAEVLTRGASASVAATWDITTATAAYALASKSSMTVAQCKAGEYLTISHATPTTNTGTISGTIALFVDYVPTFATEWDV